MGEERESERGKREREEGGRFPGEGLIFSFQVSHKKGKEQTPFEILHRPPNHRTYVLSRVIANGSINVYFRY